MTFPEGFVQSAEEGEPALQCDELTGTVLARRIDFSAQLTDSLACVC